MPSKRSCESGCSYFTWFLQVVIVLGLVSLGIWFSLQPKNPKYTIVGIHAQAFGSQNTTANVHRNTTADVHWNTTVVLKIQLSNPNYGMGVYYDDNNVTLYYGNENVGGSSILGFYQGHKKTTQKEVSVNGAEKFRSAVSRSVSNGTAKLEVRLETGFRYKIFCWKTKHHRLVLHALVPVALDGKTSDGMNIMLSQSYVATAEKIE